MLYLLAATAGGIDAISYLAMGEVFTAAMTGNTVLLGIALGQGEVLTALRSAMALLGFMVGAVLGAAIVGGGDAAAGRTRAVRIALAIEAAILIAILAIWHLAGERMSGVRLDLLVAATGVTMGLQSVAVNRMRVAGIATTYVTGTLTHLAMRFVDALRAQPKGVSAPAKPADAWLPAGVWLAYGLGAILAGAIKLLWPEAAGLSVAGEPLRWHTVALALAILPIVIVVAAPLVRRAEARL